MGDDLHLRRTILIVVLLVVTFERLACLQTTSEITRKHRLVKLSRGPIRSTTSTCRRGSLLGISLFATKPAVPTFSGYSNGEISSIGVDFAKLVMTALEKSSNPTIVLIFQYWKNSIPPVMRSLFSSVFLGDLLMFAMFQLSYKRSLRWAHKLQIVGWRLLSMGDVLNFNKSILGFLEERAGLLSKLMGCNYAIKLICLILTKLGFHIRSDLPILISKVLYAMYITHFIDLFKTRFMSVFLPSLTENRRQSYVFTRSSSVVVWSVGILVACEMVSTYLRVPLTSTLAFGGVGGLVLGFSARDIAANFLGGMLLLFNEPFTPGDMVTFRTGNTELIGRVERVGWGQTRIRGRDTRPTYIPNSHFVQTAVTNMERITHRKFETIFPIRHQDAASMMEVLARIKDGIRTVPKLDILSMPFRVSFVKVGSYGLEIEVVCYFATKSIDEFLALQQLTNLEILKAISTSGAKLALPTSQIYHNSLNTPDAQMQVQMQQVVGGGAAANLLTGEAEPQQVNTPVAVQLPATNVAASAFATTAGRTSVNQRGGEETQGAPTGQSGGSASAKGAVVSGAVAVAVRGTGARAVAANEDQGNLSRISSSSSSSPMPLSPLPSSSSPSLSLTTKSTDSGPMSAKARGAPVTIVLDGHVAGDVYDGVDFLGGAVSLNKDSTSLQLRRTMATGSDIGVSSVAVAERADITMPSRSGSNRTSTTGSGLQEQTKPLQSAATATTSISATAAIRGLVEAPSVSGSATEQASPSSSRGGGRPVAAAPLDWDLDAAFRGTSVLGSMMSSTTVLSGSGGGAGSLNSDSGSTMKGSWTFGRELSKSPTARRGNESTDATSVSSRKTTISKIRSNIVTAATRSSTSNSTSSSDGPGGKSVDRSSSSPLTSQSPSSSPPSSSQSSVSKAAVASTRFGASTSFETDTYSIDDVDDPVVEIDNSFYHEHSIDDVDDADDKWIEVDTTFGEW